MQLARRCLLLFGLLLLATSLAQAFVMPANVGYWIVFGDSRGSHTDLYYLDPGSNEVFCFAYLPGRLSALDSTPDYRYRVFVTHTPTRATAHLQIPTGRLIPFAQPGLKFSRAAIAPDGQYIALIATDSAGHGDLYLVDTQTGIFQNLTNTPREAEYQVRWSENGDWLLVIAQYNRLLKMRPDGSEARQLAIYGSGISLLSVSPDNEWLNLVRNTTNNGYTFRLKMDGSETLHGPSVNFDAVWSPDGQAVYHGTTATPRGLYRSDINTASAQLLRMFPLDLGAIRPSPDWEWLLITGRDFWWEQWALYRLRINGSDLQSLTSPGAYTLGLAVADWLPAPERATHSLIPTGLAICCVGLGLARRRQVE